MGADRVLRLSKIAIGMFQHMNEKTYYPQQYRDKKAFEMHYVASLIKDLVDIAYPLEEETEEHPYWEAYKKIVDFLREDNCPRIKIPTYEQWQQWLKMERVE